MTRHISKAVLVTYEYYVKDQEAAAKKKKTHAEMERIKIELQFASAAIEENQIQDVRREVRLIRARTRALSPLPPPLRPHPYFLSPSHYSVFLRRCFFPHPHLNVIFFPINFLIRYRAESIMSPQFISLGYILHVKF